MHADQHVIGPVGDGVVHHLGVARNQPVRILALGLALFADLRVAQIDKEDIVHLQVAAAGGVECLDGLLVGRGDVGEIGVGIVLVVGDRDVVLGDAEMDGARSGNGDLRGHLGIGGDELVMLEHRMIRREVELAVDHRHIGGGGHAMELDAAAFPALDIEPVEHAHEIEMPPGPAEFAVGNGHKAGVFLHLNDAANGFVLDGVKLFGGHGLVLEMGLARLLDGIGPQETADHVGAERRGGLGHRGKSFS